MRFVAGYWENSRGKSDVIYRPVDVTEADTHLPDPSIWGIDLEDTRRIVSARVLEMVAKFSLDLDRRRRLGHHCAMFAVACQTGNSMDQVNFRDGSHVIFPGRLVRLSDPGSDPMASRKKWECYLRPGQVLFASNMPPDNLDFSQSGADGHYMVRASGRGDDDPLYASKMWQDGPVVLHGLTALRRLLPIETIALADGMDLYTRIGDKYTAA